MTKLNRIKCTHRTRFTPSDILEKSKTKGALMGFYLCVNLSRWVMSAAIVYFVFRSEWDVRWTITWFCVVKFIIGMSRVNGLSCHSSMHDDILECDMCPRRNWKKMIFWSFYKKIHIYVFFVLSQMIFWWSPCSPWVVREMVRI